VSVIGFPVFLIFVVAIVVLLIATASRSRDAQQPRLCRTCGAAHPPFAQYCRRCGRKM